MAAVRVCIQLNCTSDSKMAAEKSYSLAMSIPVIYISMIRLVCHYYVTLRDDARSAAADAWRLLRTALFTQADQLSFPLNRPDLGLVTTDKFVKRFQVSVTANGVQPIRGRMREAPIVTLTVQ